MTVNNDIDDGCATKQSDSHTETCLVAFRPERLVPLSHGHARGSNGSSAQPDMSKTTVFGRIVNPTRRLGFLFL